MSVNEQKRVIDDLGREVFFSFPPQRIVSLVPSITELLFDLGLDDKIVGVTSYCIHPKQAKSKVIVGGTKNVDASLIRRLKPDLILAEKSENQKENVLDVAAECSVYTFDISGFDDAIKMIQTVGILTSTTEQANEISKKVTSQFRNLGTARTSKTVFYPVWKNPYITINASTFISSMLKFCGLKNIFDGYDKSYPVVDLSEVINHNPDIILLPSEPYEFSQDDMAELKSLFPNSKLFLVDGEMFAWYGSRMLKAVDYFSELIKMF
ncbi:MAG: hypothetical protein PWR03_2181 [Tenuifilum sp.]|uniref:helical backbone metal receptor n=1 Tax=Tenuifilum sp. TaxID=2760880 RepID=UPI0024AC313F|nr:helical backbone metal receptor [Tenuifilum sp.]MDI3527997.1 hypothetical protein [Tenuifilum sp.]